MEWISVEDKLPDIETDILICDKVRGKIFVGYFYQWWSNYSQEFVSEWYLTGARGREYRYMAKVTHWMPLPELPNEE